MRVLIAAGGTAGHVNPALAIAKGIKTRNPSAEIHFAGRRGGMEKRLVEAAGYPFHHIEVQGIQRSFKPKAIARNIAAVWHLAFAPFFARRLIKKVDPQLVIGAGGYVSGPVVLRAARMGCKTAIQEQNAYPGVTNKLLAQHADVIFAPTQSAKERLGHPEKTMVTGNPVRPELFEQNREEARDAIGANGRVVLVSFGGSLGAMKMNEMVARLAQWHLKNRDFLHIHATGTIEKADFAEMAKNMGINNNPNFEIREYINNMPALLAASDLVICRAGAGTLAELAAVGRASVLIPSPNVAENHQYYNAMEFEKAGAAKVFEESGLSAEEIISTVDEYTKEPETLAKMGQAAKTLANPNALNDILNALEKLMGAAGEG